MKKIACQHLDVLFKHTAVSYVTLMYATNVWCQTNATQNKMRQRLPLRATNRQSKQMRATPSKPDTKQRPHGLFLASNTNNPCARPSRLVYDCNIQSTEEQGGRPSLCGCLVSARQLRETLTSTTAKYHARWFARFTRLGRPCWLGGPTVRWSS